LHLRRICIPTALQGPRGSGFCPVAGGLATLPDACAQGTGPVQGAPSEKGSDPGGAGRSEGRSAQERCHLRHVQVSDSDSTFDIGTPAPSRKWKKLPTTTLKGGSPASFWSPPLNTLHWRTPATSVGAVAPLSSAGFSTRCTRRSHLRTSRYAAPGGRQQTAGPRSKLWQRAPLWMHATFTPRDATAHVQFCGSAEPLLIRGSPGFT
jgi:hypothetical protein